MTLTEVRAEVHKLAEVFKVPEPEVVERPVADPLEVLMGYTPPWKTDGLPILRGPGDAITAVYTSHRDPRMVHGVTLCVGPAVGLQQIRHEFAHVLYAHRYGGYGSREEHERTRGGHDERFYDLLLQVLLRSPGDPRLYQWERDYPHLREWARRDGYYTPGRKERANVPVS